jgi:prepilin-type N-terminal cleavage/methylation domain-containing protein
MKKNNLHTPWTHGFTLVEMAMVLAIVSLLMAGLLPTISSQIEQQRINESRKQLEDIRQTLIGFAVINGRLPCPAEASLDSGNANAGKEAISAGNACACQSSGSTTAVYGSATQCSQTSVSGVLPWATLGLSETDSWNRRFTYRVSSHFADKIAANTYGTGCSPGTNLLTSSFAICSPGTPDIYDASGTLVYEDVPLVVVSHGSNGLGGYTTTGSKISDSTGDELENSDDDLSFVSHEFSSNFDDLLTWVSPNSLINRMVAAGKLP